MKKGAFQISREIFENPIWNDIPKFRIFFYIVGNAVFSHEGVKKGDIHIKRGQFLRSYRNLRDDLEFVENRAVKKYSLSLIKRKIEQLEREQRLKIESTELGTLFTVVNYALYQGLENYKNDNENAERTQRERSWNAERTQREQRENNNKNVKNVKNDNNIIKYIVGEYENNIGPMSSIILQSIDKWIDEFNEPQEIISKAIQIAALNNKNSWSYIESILNNWFNSELKTLDQVNAFLLEYKRNQQEKKKSYFKANKQQPKKSDIPHYIENQPTKQEETESDTEKDKRMNELMKELGEI